MAANYDKWKQLYGQTAQPKQEENQTKGGRSTYFDTVVNPKIQAAFQNVGTNGQNSQSTGTQSQMPTFDPKQNGWYQQAQNLMGQIQNRGPFEFNLNKNALWQQLKDRYMQQGQQAMMDTMGQAAGLTGGYGSSYAQNVGQQAYNQHLTELSKQVPELYAQERAAYDAEGDRLYQQLSAERSMYDTDYQQWRDLVGDYRYADELAYNRGRDAISDARYNQEYADSRADLLYNRQYQEGRDALTDQIRQREWDYQVARDAISDERYAAERDYENTWRERQYNDSRSDSTYSRVMQQISSGYMPSAEELQAAGISQGYAQYLVNMYAQQQAAAAQGSTGGSNPGYTPQTPPQTPTQTPPQTPPTGDDPYSILSQPRTYSQSDLDSRTYNGLRQQFWATAQNGGGGISAAAQLYSSWNGRLSRTQDDNIRSFIMQLYK